MFESVAGFSIDDIQLFFRSILFLTIFIFSALCTIQIFKAYQAGGFDSEADVIVIFGRVLIFLLVILVTLVYSY